MHNFKKYYGQNFLTSSKYLNKFMSYLSKDNDVVIEIGPGDGRLTDILLDNFPLVISIEIDQDLIPILNSKFKNNKNFILINKSILEFKLLEISNLINNQQKIAVIGSLPYNISKQIIKKFLVEENNISELILLAQREVVDDYLAVPPKATFLSNFIGTYSSVKKGIIISSEYFFPKPKVDGEILILYPYNKNFNYEKLIKFIKVGFSNPRKNIKNNLKSFNNINKILLDLDININNRPANLKISEWKNLYNKVYEQT